MNADEIVMAERLKEIADRHKAATPGPWKFWDRDTKFAVGSVDFGNFDAMVVNECQWNIGSILQRKDADFISHAHEDVPFLLDLVESLQAQLSASQRREKAAVMDIRRPSRACTCAADGDCRNDRPGHRQGN